MSESDSWSMLRVALVKAALMYKSAIHLTRIENLIGSGVFDTNLCFKGTEVWLEGKYLQRFPVRKTSAFKVGLSDDQEAWAIRRLLVGGRLFLWCYCATNGCSSALTSKKISAKNNVDAGKGWYLFKLDSVDIIKAVRQGLKCSDVLSNHNTVSKYFSSADLLAGYLLAQGIK